MDTDGTQMGNDAGNVRHAAIPLGFVTERRRRGIFVEPWPKRNPSSVGATSGWPPAMPLLRSGRRWWLAGYKDFAP